MENNSQLAVREKESKQLVFMAQKQFEVSNEYKMNFNREAGFAIQILINNPFLMKCDPDSVKHSIVNVALTGLTLNPALKYAYFVPRKSKDGLKCILDISYIGMIKILTDAGAVKNVDAGVIYSNDKYDFRRGSDPYFKHQPALSNRGEKIGAYAIAFLRDGGFQFEILGREEIEKIRATSESYKNEEGRKYSPWETWEDEMWKKSALKRLFKLLPKTNFSEQLIASISHDYENEVSDLKTPEDKYAGIFEDIPEAQVINDPPKKEKKQPEKTPDDKKEPDIFKDQK
jgi:recombination protein RecT